MRHELKTTGTWVELREIEDLRAKDRKEVKAAMVAGLRVDPETNQPVLDDAVKVMTAYESAVPEAIATRLISTWHIPYLPDAKIPLVDPDALDKLKIDDYDLLMEIVAPIRQVLMPSSSNNVDEHADPSSPSEPASG